MIAYQGRHGPKSLIGRNLPNGGPKTHLTRIMHPYTGTRRLESLTNSAELTKALLTARPLGFAWKPQPFNRRRNPSEPRRG